MQRKKRQIETVVVVAKPDWKSCLTVANAPHSSKEFEWAKKVWIPLSPPLFIGKSENDSRNSIPSCPDLTRIVTAWAKLPAPLKAAVLAIIN